MVIQTSNINEVKNIFKRYNLPKSDSHKGQNGKVLIIGGSSLFHAASLWAAEVCSHFVDMVHYSSTVENEKIFHDLKKTFRNGIIVPNKELDHYVKEDDVVLIGPGMVRGDKRKVIGEMSLREIQKLNNEAEYTRELTFYLINNYPEKKFVFDAGALQMMDKDWILKLKETPIITPHKKEFESLFAEYGSEVNVKKMAGEYKSLIMMKSIKDIVSDGEKTIVIEGGNQGLTKGGTGDVLAGLTASFYTKNNSLDSAVYSSVLLKMAADELFKSSGYWYNISDIIKILPKILAGLIEL